MNISFFIARRIAFNSQHSFSRFIIRLAVAATAVSVAAMIITLAFVNGFQQTVSQKVFSFWGHIHLQAYEPGKALVAEETPLAKNDSMVKALKQFQGIKTIQSFATKSAVLQQQSNIEGILFKGVESDYNFSHLKSFLKEGQWPSFADTLYSHDIVVSKPIALLLQAKLNDTVKIHFIDAAGGKSNFRKLRICGIYKTGIEEYDKLFAIGDVRLVQRLNKWESDETGGYEIFLDDYNSMEKVNAAIRNSDLIPSSWASKTVKEVYPNIFDWLGIQDVNRNVIFIVMSIIAIINLVTCLLILVLERTRMVGILKAIGSRNITIQGVFLLHSTYIALVGVVIGFIAGVGLCLLQQSTGFISMDETNYYVAVAPIKIVWWQVWSVCAGTIAVCFISLIFPTLLVRSLQPVKAIQFR